MEYKSKQQEKYFNVDKNKKKIGKKEVEKSNKQSKGKQLPDKVKPKK